MSIQNLGPLFEKIVCNNNISTDFVRKMLIPDDDILIIERPADRSDRWERATDIPADIKRRESEEHTCIGYFSDWKYLVDTTGREYAWKGGQGMKIESVPNRLIKKCKLHLSLLSDLESDRKELGINKRLKSDLESLGYI